MVRPGLIVALYMGLSGNDVAWRFLTKCMKCCFVCSLINSLLTCVTPSKLFTESERFAERRTRPLRAGSPAVLEKVASGSATESLSE